MPVTDSRGVETVKAMLLCRTGRHEVDCINVDAILVRFTDGRNLVLTEESLRNVDPQLLKASAVLPGHWLHQRAEEFFRGREQPA